MMLPAYTSLQRWTIRGSMILAILVLAGVQARAEETSVPPLSPIKLQSSARIELGRMLFFDRRLSGDGTMSCAVCHIPGQAFSDGRNISGAYPTNKHWRNTPSLINAAYLEQFFWDGRSSSLEDQAAGPIESPFEMNGDLQFAVAKLSEIPEYQTAFQRAFASEVSRAGIVAALAAFEQTLTVIDSPFDRYLAGESQALNAVARKGMELFFGPRGGCSQCHTGSLLSDQKYYNLGIAPSSAFANDPQHRTTLRYVLALQGVPMQSDDPGRYLVSGKSEDWGAFRTPPLRQVAQTGPYMHNGSMKTLADVVAFFSRGGGDDPRKSKLLKVRNFTAAEQASLVAFLESLSGTVPEVRRPHLPGD